MFRVHTIPQTVCGSIDSLRPALSNSRASSPEPTQAMAIDLPQAGDGRGRTSRHTQRRGATPANPLARLPLEVWRHTVRLLGVKDALPLRATRKAYLEDYHQVFPDAFCTTLLRDAREGNPLVDNALLRRAFGRARHLDLYDERLLQLPLDQITRMRDAWHRFGLVRGQLTRRIMAYSYNLRSISTDLLTLTALFAAPGRAPTLERICVLLGGDWERGLFAMPAHLLPERLALGPNVRALSITWHGGYCESTTETTSYAYVGQLFADVALQALGVFVPSTPHDAYKRIHAGLFGPLQLTGLRELCVQAAPSQDGLGTDAAAAEALFATVFARCSATLQRLALESPSHDAIVPYFRAYLGAMGGFVWPQLHTACVAGAHVGASADVTVADPGRFPALRTLLLVNVETPQDLAAAFVPRRPPQLQALAISTFQAQASDDDVDVAIDANTPASAASAHPAAQPEHPQDSEHPLAALQLCVAETCDERDFAWGEVPDFRNAHANALLQRYRPRVDWFARLA